MIVDYLGFIKEEDFLRLKGMTKNKDKLKEVHIDMYPENPLTPSNSFSLLLRTSEKNASISIDNDRLIFKRNDGHKTHFMNILISTITECFSNIHSDYSEFVLKVQNIYYKITIFN